ncbi:hypothetical protein ACIBI0_31410 [Microbispora rosea]|uniref:hypothetical protein n=1 Tax=Microbispora rosea TaxID=58117 RepID=UPI003430CB31
MAAGIPARRLEGLAGIAGDPSALRTLRHTALMPELGGGLALIASSGRRIR